MILETVNLSDLATKIIDQLKQHEPDRRIEVTITPEMLVQGDKNLLQLALENLLKKRLEVYQQNFALDY